MEDLNRIGSKLKKIHGWVLIMMYAEKGNYEKPFFFVANEKQQHITS